MMMMMIVMMTLIIIIVIGLTGLVSLDGPTDLSLGLLTLHSICIELIIRSGTIVKFSASKPDGF